MVKKKYVVAIDAMGGDYGLEVTLPAAITSLERHPKLSIVLVGDQALIDQNLTAWHREKFGERLNVVHASEVVGMGESPARALRNKKDSSMRVAINLVKEGTADACVSAGNTGALMATAKFVLKTISGISRPAIISRIPNIKGHCLMLDLGANLDCTAEHLFQFAVMGSVMASAIHGLDRPTVGLLNVGEEQIKGNEPVKQANNLLLATPEINYVGFVEGNDIYSGKVDVVVCDGFAGNVALKASEGLVRHFYSLLQQELMRNIFTKIVGLVAKFTLKNLFKKLDPKKYNGASLVGLNGIVLKSHGSANEEEAFANAISVALNDAELNVPMRIRDQVSSLVKEQQ